MDLGALAVSLAMDATAAAAGIGAGARTSRPVLVAAALFGLFQAGMSGLGWWGGAWLGRVAAAWDHWIAFGLLAGLGLKAMHAAWTKPAADEPGPGLGPVALVVLAFATSVDALVAGVTLPTIGVGAGTAVAVIGMVTAALSLCGGQLGRRVGDRLGGRLEIAGGLVLVLLGCKILVEHLQGA